MDYNVKDLSHLPETFKVYLASFIDGEGSLALCQNGPRLVVAQANLEILEHFKNTTGLGYISEKKKYKAHHKPSWDWSVGSVGMRAILPIIIPYMIIKKARAELMLEYLGILNQTGGPLLPERKALRDSYQQKLKGV